MPDPILALDLGTSSTKGLLVGSAGEVLAAHSASYPTHTPCPGHAEQDPGEVMAAVREVLAALGGPDTDVVLSCAMHTLVPVGSDGAPLGRVWTWADRRAAPEAAELRSGPRAPGLHARTGTPLHASSPLCKLRHLQRVEPARFAAAARFVSLKELVVEALTGERCVDHAVASSTGLLDVHRREWDREALELAGVDAAHLSPLVPTDRALPAGGGARSVVVGSTDGALANLGVGADDSRTVCITLGTSGAVRVVYSEPRTDPTGQRFCYVVDATRYVVGGALNNGGLVLRWLGRLLGGASDADLIETAAAVPPGSDGLLLVPTLTGERFPSYRSDLRGIAHGLTLEHDRGHLVRAGLEGVMLAVAPLFDALRAEAAVEPEVRIGGGLVEFPFCRQMLADVLGCPVHMPASRDSSALGAARLGFAALGRPADWPIEMAHTHEPDPGRHRLYRELRQRRGLLEAAQGEWC
ncbi:MAG: gluconokinase [Planctomycetes bacterium]|nr:gluconokinase [Planctomycetota bacterium]MCB9889694.1 gluconokinase [Planctomycetota bacterium]